MAPTPPPASPSGLSSVLLFGPQALSFDRDAMQTLRTFLHEDEECRWMLGTISELPGCWSRLVAGGRFPKLQEVHGEKWLRDLDAWLRDGKLGKAVGASQLPNTVLTPLVVLTQLTQFSRYLSHSLSGASAPARGEDRYQALAQQDVTATGLCTGLLSASAVSSCSDQASFRKYGAVAIRLAMVIGALVDAQDATDRLHGLSRSFSVLWSSPAMAKELVMVLDCFPEAYLSVLFDDKRATLTTAEGTAPLLLRQLREKGVLAAPVGLSGRFHCQCHHDDLEELLRFCDADEALQFPSISALHLPIHLDASGDQPRRETRLHEAVLRMILVEQSDWYATFSHILSARLATSDSVLVSLGPDKGVPPSLLRRLGPRLVHAGDLFDDQAAPALTDSVFDPSSASSASSAAHAHAQRRHAGGGDGAEGDIAVVGMSCQVAGASDLGEFWDILCEGRSQHVEVPPERFGPETQWRDVDPGRKWYGNFIRDHDVFDHKFFRKSPRESVSTDPQQRLMLQCAYQAVEQSGYFHQPPAASDPRIGCYLGACAADYEQNVAGYPANAFTATGNLKSFIAGKISHYFGWTGPGMTIDSACSASAVAIHQACKAIIGGECSGALAGGVGLMGNITWFQNLAGASFLSPTGQCKPWDEKADGYCRGEAVAVVFLKKMSDAIADGNQILGSIAATAVFQNENCTPVFVPNSPSLSYLFKSVMQQAGLDPRSISVVECHGTGTPVGDPAEYESVLQALGGPARDEPLALGSVKGLVGHTEGASGVVSLIKMILMIQNGFIPPQASFTTMTHLIKASPSDNMEIVTKLKPWDKDFRGALINNYGASGSNASIIVTQPSHGFQDSSRARTPIHTESLRHPFWLCGLDDRALRAYATKLQSLIRASPAASASASKRNGNLSLANLAFNMYRQSNRRLDRGLMFSCGTLDELDDKLSAFVSGDSSVASQSTKAAPRPVVMCFGGQVSTWIGLDRRVYDSVKILRGYLDQCNAVFLSIGLDGIYPEVFQRHPVDDTIKLQTMLFATQYACAKSWMDCGVQVAAAVGHSFGELTALCISGVLSLKDTAKMIAARARVVQEAWGPDRGGMVAIEADQDLVSGLLGELQSEPGPEPEVTIACYNGPRSFTLAGPTAAIDKVTDVLQGNPAYASAARFKRLNVTNAFHSALVEPLTDDLGEIGHALTLREPTILLERCTEELDVGPITPGFVASHMRDPVYFDHAVQRLARQYPEAVWLEAGSNSTITKMASRALGSPAGSHFQALNITCDQGLQNLSDATLALWKAGVPSAYWPHHAGQTYEYGHLFLPPYQFEKSRHWMDLKKPLRAQDLALAQHSSPNAHGPGEEDEPAAVTTLWSFAGFQDKAKQKPRFRVNTETQVYNDFVSGHWIAETAPICPATLEADMVIETLMSIRPELERAGMQPIIQKMQNHAPICTDPTRDVYIDFGALDAGGHSWSWSIISLVRGKAQSSTTVHVDGRLVFRPTTDPDYRAEFDRYARFFTHQRCLAVLDSAEADDIIQGRNIYRTFAEIVDYGEQYRGLKRLVGVGSESAGRVCKKHSGETWLDTHLSDCFSQVGGIWVNCMTSRDPGDMFIASGCELVMRSPSRRQHDGPRPEVWDVLAHHHQTSDKSYTTDIMVFDASSGEMVEIMLGINYAKVAKASMQRILARLSGNSPPSKLASKSTASVSGSGKIPTARGTVPTGLEPVVKVGAGKSEPKAPRRSAKPQTDIKNTVRNVLANVSGLEPEDIGDDTELADVGIDSLMGMELAREVELVFKCKLPVDQLAEVTNFTSFVDCIQGALGPSAVDVEDGENTDDDDDDDDDGDFSGLHGTSSENNTTNTGTTTPSSSAGGDGDGDGQLQSKVDVMAYLNDLLGVDDIQRDTLLVDLGVDSLLSTELRSDLASKFGVRVAEDVSLEAMSVAELNALINGQDDTTGGPAKKAPPAASPHQAQPTPAADKRPQAPTNASQPGSSRAGPGPLLPATAVLDSFGRAKNLTDQLIREFKIDDFANTVCPKSTQLCIALTLEAMEKLGVSMRSAKPGETIPRVQHVSQHRRLVEYLYEMLDKEARLVDAQPGGRYVRTAVAPPAKSSAALLQDLLRLHPDWGCAMRLTQFAGTKLADVLTGRTDGIRVIFGSEEGRTLVAGLYRDHVFNKMSYHQMAGYVEDLLSRVELGSGPLRIMEMGAGTGGTTFYMAPLLERLGVDVEYTFTDLSPSMVAAARKTFKRYPFMRFMAHDIEDPVPAELAGTQHIIIASNAVHATHDLVKSGANIRNALREDGFLMMLEMTQIVPFVDVIFGLLEGWWLFDDGRSHAIISPAEWETALHAAGFGHVDWSDGHLPENKIQKVIIAMASGPPRTRLPISPQTVPETGSGSRTYPDLASREKDISAYVARFSAGFQAPVATAAAPAGATPPESRTLASDDEGQKKCVLITGATGSLGTHLVKEMAERDDVARVICLNRRRRSSSSSSSSAADPTARQAEALALRGVRLGERAMRKLEVLETDSHRPRLGLGAAAHAALGRAVTSILHSAWPMSGSRPVRGFEAQFQALRNLVDLARDAAGHAGGGTHEHRGGGGGGGGGGGAAARIDFQLVSSIGVAGHYPLWSGEARVPEERMELRSVLPNGYCDAKFACERILDETLHRYPRHFHVMTARLGQVAGSRTSGFWNPMEHFSFMVKSSQTFKAFPQLEGSLSWCPVNDMAAALAEILLTPTAGQPIYHIDNPAQQPWPAMLRVLTEALGLDPATAIVPFDDWIDRVRRSPLAPETDNPAARLVDFLDEHFRRMSCGGLVLDTAKACADSPALAAVGPVEDEVVRKYVSAWRDMGFLH